MKSILEATRTGGATVPLWTVLLVAGLALFLLGLAVGLWVGLWYDPPAPVFVPRKGLSVAW